MDKIFEKSCEKCANGEKCPHRAYYRAGKKNMETAGLIHSAIAKTFTSKLEACLGQVCEGYKAENPLAGKPLID